MRTNEHASRNERRKSLVLRWFDGRHAGMPGQSRSIRLEALSGEVFLEVYRLILACSARSLALALEAQKE